MSKLWDEIKRISDELELKVHLASMDAKDKWNELKPRVKALEVKMEELNNVGTLIKELRDDVVGRAK